MRAVLLLVAVSVTAHADLQDPFGDTAQDRHDRLYAAYVADLRAAGATIPSRDEIAFDFVDHLPSISLDKTVRARGREIHYARGAYPERLHPSRLLVDTGGQIRLLRTPQAWNAKRAQPWRILGCMPGYTSGLARIFGGQAGTGAEEDLRQLEQAECVDLTPSVRALAPADATDEQVEALLALMLSLQHATPGSYVVGQVADLGGTFPRRGKMEIAPPSIRRSVGRLEVHGYAVVPSGQLRTRYERFQLSVEPDGLWLTEKVLLTINQKQ